jgi:hypothetical protein
MLYFRAFSLRICTVSVSSSFPRPPPSPPVMGNVALWLHPQVIVNELLCYENILYLVHCEK